MALLDSPKLDPQNVHYNDVIALPIASGYDFVNPTATHEVRIKRVNPAHAVNPGYLVMTEGPAGEWTVPAWDLALQIDGNPDLINFDVNNDLLYINPVTLPVEDEFYVIGVVEIATGRAVDIKFLFLEKQNLDIFDATTATVDTDTLEVALGLAGDNVKQRKSEYLAGQLSSFEVAIFNSGVNLSLDEADIDSDVGLEKVIEATHIVDNMGDVKTSTTVRTL
jgi:hypothetical protein